jgi:osmotically-inducible protein OsmY
MTRTRQFCGVAFVAILALSLSACAAYHKCGFRGCPGDAAITADVEAQIRLHPALEAPNSIHVQTLDHTVYLTGQVDTELQRSLAESLARAVKGVTRVANSITFSFEGK